MLIQVDVVYEDEDGPQALALPIKALTPRDSLLLYKVTGLDSPPINLFMGDYARDGGYYQDRRVDKRNPVFTIGLNPDPTVGETVSGLRELLYRVFLDPLEAADHVQFVLHDDNKNSRYILGYTEQVETDIFDAEAIIQFSVICPDPYIRDVDDTVFQSSSGWASYPFTYEGSAEVGFEVDINITSNSLALTLDVNGRTMVFSRDFVTGDAINIITRRGEREASLTRAGVTTSLLPYLSPLSRWVELHGKKNVLKVYGESESDVIAAATRISYSASYWGI